MSKWPPTLGVVFWVFFYHPVHSTFHGGRVSHQSWQEGPREGGCYTTITFTLLCIILEDVPPNFMFRQNPTFPKFVQETKFLDFLQGAYGRKQKKILLDEG